MEIPLIVQLTVACMMLITSGLGVYWYILDRQFAVKQHIPMSSKHRMHIFLGACSLMLPCFIIMRVHLSSIGLIAILLFMGISFTSSALWDNWRLFRFLRERKLQQHPPFLQHIELPYPLFELQFGLLYTVGGCTLSLKYLFGVNDETLIAWFFLIFLGVASIGFGLLLNRWKRLTMSILLQERDLTEEPG